jgi:hypothetical protein
MDPGISLVDDILATIFRYLDFATATRAGMANKRLRQLLESDDSRWRSLVTEAIRLEVDAVDSEPKFLGSDAAYSFEPLFESHEVEASLLSGGWKAVVTDVERQCRYCCATFKLLEVLQAQHSASKRNCRRHAGVFYSVHEVVSWDGGGDSWDREVWLCCRQDSKDAPGCVTGIHVERNLGITFDNIDYNALYEDPENPIVRVESAMDTNDASEERNFAYEPNRNDVCGECSTHPCSCRDALLFDFDEREIPKKR